MFFKIQNLSWGPIFIISWAGNLFFKESRGKKIAVSYLYKSHPNNSKITMIEHKAHLGSGNISSAQKNEFI